jgi:hypothetical protein
MSLKTMCYFMCFDFFKTVICQEQQIHTGSLSTDIILIIVNEHDSGHRSTFTFG